MAGNEEPFPEPDNQSKMKRSCENAEHVGEYLCYLMNHSECATYFFNLKASSPPTLVSTFETSSAAADPSKSIAVPTRGYCAEGKLTILGMIGAPDLQHSKSAASSTCTPRGLSTD